MPAPRGTAPIRARSDSALLGAAPQQVPRHRTKAPDAVRVAIGAAAAEEEEEEEHEPIGIPGLRPPTGLFLAPDAGMRVIEPPSLSWDPIANVRLYRLRLFRGTREVFEVATVEPSVSLPRSWRYDGVRQTLQPGLYRWEVRSVSALRAHDPRERLLKQSSFVFIVARPHSA